MNLSIFLSYVYKVVVLKVLYLTIMILKSISNQPFHFQILLYFKLAFYHPHYTKYNCWSNEGVQFKYILRTLSLAI